jgi:glycosyltransferase involved in cell wall biosynthesis
MQRVLVFRSELLPRSETFVAAQAGALRRFSPCFAGLRRVPDGIPLDAAKVLTLTSRDALVDKMHRRFFMRTGIAPRLLSGLRSLKPALIHAHFAVDAAAALPFHKKLGIPMIVSLHDYDVTSSDAVLGRFAAGRVYLRRKSELYRRASVFVCVSDYIRGKAVERGFPEAKLRTHFIGVDLDAFRPDPAVPREPIVLFVGRLVEKKGCTHLIRAMAMIQDQHPEAQLIMVGDGTLRDELRGQAEASVRRFTFAGAQPSSAVRALMQRASVLAAPSIVAATGDAEGLPIVICEAQAMALPVAGFRGPGVSEAVVEKETALLADSRDERGLAAAISALLSDSALRARMGAAGRDRVERFFSLSSQTAKLEGFYDEIQANGPHISQC